MAGNGSTAILIGNIGLAAKQRDQNIIDVRLRDTRATIREQELN